MKKKAKSRGRTQGGNPSTELASLVEPMLAGMTATREHLLAWVHAEGLAALDELFREEAEGRGPGRAQGPTPSRAHAPSLGHDGDGADLRGAPAAGAAPAGAGDQRPGAVSYTHLTLPTN